MDPHNYLLALKGGRIPSTTKKMKKKLLTMNNFIQDGKCRNILLKWEKKKPLPFSGALSWVQKWVLVKSPLMWCQHPHTSALTSNNYHAPVKRLKKE